MKNVTKRFVEVLVCEDMEGRHMKWVGTDKTYEEAVKELREVWLCGYHEVRLVDKTFNPETFEITEEVVKLAERIHLFALHTWKVKEY